MPNGGFTSTLPRFPELIPDSFTVSLTIVYHMLKVLGYGDKNTS